VNTALVPAEAIDRAILVIRGHKVMLDSDLAKLYEVETKVFNQAVKRNLDLFPDDFMFQLTEDEWDTLRTNLGTSHQLEAGGGSDLRSQSVTSKKRAGGRRYSPYVFTEQGVAMLSGVLKSNKAKRVNIEIMRAFVRLRQVLATHEEFRKRFEEIESRLDSQDNRLRVVFDAILELMEPVPPAPSRQIGF